MIVIQCLKVFALSLFHILLISRKAQPTQNVRKAIFFNSWWTTVDMLKKDVIRLPPFFHLSLTIFTWSPDWLLCVKCQAVFAGWFCGFIWTTALIEMAVNCVNWISYFSESVHQKSIDLSSETAGIRVNTCFILIQRNVSFKLMYYVIFYYLFMV